MNWFRHPNDEKLIAELRSEIAFLRQDVKRLEKLLGKQTTPKPRLRSIQLAFTKGSIMAEGPVVLSSGQSTIASVDYFDQTGQLMPTDGSFTPPDVTFSIDNASVASSTPVDAQHDTVTYVSAGGANLTASVTSAEGLALSDTASVTCSPVVLPPPVLSSIKVNFATPTP